MPILETKQKKFCYGRFGDTADPVLVLISGITSQLIHWPSSLINALVNAGIQIIVFDNRDVGLSQYYDDLETPSLESAMTALQQGHFVPPYTLQDMARDVWDLLDALEISQGHLCGMSLGGVIAQFAALAEPTRCQSLSLVATTSGDHDLPPPSPEVMDFFFNQPKNLGKDEQLQRHIAQHKLYLHEEDFDEAKVCALQKQAYDRAYHPAGNLRQLLAMMGADPRGEALTALTMPSLILHGDHDPMVSTAHAEALHQALSNSQLKIYEKMGHGLPERCLQDMAHRISKLVHAHG